MIFLVAEQGIQLPDYKNNVQQGGRQIGFDADTWAGTVTRPYVIGVDS